MATPVTLPRMGESVMEGTIVRWLKREGDWVNEDEPLVEISTDKIDTELPSPAAGVLTRISVKEDTTVEVGTEIAVIDESAREGSPPAPSPRETPPREAGEQPEEPTEGNGQVARRRTPDAQLPETQEAERASEEPAATTAPSLSPLVRRLARERGVDLATVSGTGAGGRITKRDVLDAAEHGLPRDAGRPSAAVPAATVPAAQEAAPSLFAVPASATEDVPFTHVRRAIAEHMVRSRHTAAHVTNIVEVDFTRIAALRSRGKGAFEEAEGFSLTFLPFVAAGVVQTLRAFPELNAHVLEDGRTARLFRQVHLGIAVGRDEGLIVPVVKGADGMNLVGLARAIRDVSDRARRKGALRPDDVGGGTFTVTNYGSVGGVLDTPIINQPQVAILGVGAIVKRPAVISVDGADAIAIRHIAFLSLSYDHRWIDGHRAAMFNVRLKALLEAADFAQDLGLEPHS